jgi:DNA-3-methyladenine glycosylase
VTERAAQAARRARREVLPLAFYDRETELVSRELLGAVLEHRTSEGVTAGRIVETEAYLGEHDPACHAAVGNTGRTRWLYGAPGTAYVYFIYGTHWCFNAVTRGVGLPSAVLIRALEPVTGVKLLRARRPAVSSDRELTNGPGKVCAALGIDGSLNGHRLNRTPLRIFAGSQVPDSEVMVSARIGITKASDWPLRWFIAGNRYVSRAPRGIVPRSLTG